MSPVRSTRDALAVATPFRSCQALIPISRNAQVNAEARIIWTRRYGKDGLKTISSQLRAWNWPLTISYPAGVCIHELRARIQNALINVPNATRKVAPR